jgi:superfamily II DNA or RNA helicase
MIIEVEKINETYAFLKCDRSIAQELNDYFSFFTPGYKFMAAYKSRLWDGKIRLAKFLPNGDLQFYIGLMHQLEVFCKDRDYILNKNYKDKHNSITKEILSDFIEKLNVHSDGKPLTPRDYQFDGVLDFINTKRQVLISPTSSGKSLIIYLIIRFLLKCNLKKILLIVPNTSLCHQLASDFSDYSSHNSWDADKHIHLVFAGKDKNSDKEIILSTWQSLYTIKDSNYFKQFDIVINDECHLASGKEITAIVEKCINAAYRIGVTGTLNGKKIHSLQLESLFGKVKQAITTKELMDNKQVTELAIKCLVLRYPEHLTKLTQKLKYQQELEYLISNSERNKFIKNLVLSLKGNTLLLYQYVEKHGDVLFDLISKSKHAVDKKIYYIHGNIKAEERESIRKAMETQDNVILIGSVGTVSTGTNIKNLHNIIFASPSKSRVRNLQAIGRVLRLNENKDKAILYDLADDLRYKKHQNYTMTHFEERIKIYNEEKFDFKIINVELNVPPI